MKNLPYAIIIAVAAFAACTSTVVVEGSSGSSSSDAGSSGAGAMGSSSTNDAAATSGPGSTGAGASGPGSTGAGTGGEDIPPAPCEQACINLFVCGLENDNCPGFSMIDPQQFVAGCEQTCNSTPALISLIDPNDCEGTINTIKAVSADFAAACDGAP